MKILYGIMLVCSVIFILVACVANSKSCAAGIIISPKLTIVPDMHGAIHLPSC